MRETLLTAFDGKSAFSFGRSEKFSYSEFGGPNEFRISGKRSSSLRLHKIARLSCSHFPIGDTSYVSELPLLYGMLYGGSGLTYRFESSEIHVLENQGKLTDDFPYRDYPLLLPFVPLAVQGRKKQTWRQFASPFPNMKDEQPADIVVVVPPPMTIGVSLWGYWGDAEGVTLVFECDLSAQKVTAYNVCT
jgi:hypothetical protein